MERIINAIEANPEALFFKISNSQGIRKANGSAENPEELKEKLATEIEYLNPDTYTILLGRNNNLSPQRAAVSINYKVVSNTPSKPMSRSNIEMFSHDYVEQVKKEAYEAGRKEAILLDHENRLTRIESKLEAITNKINEIIRAVDELDGEEDGSIGDKAVAALQQFSAAKEALSTFKF